MQANPTDPTGGPTPPSDRRPVDEPERPRDELYAIAEHILEGERINWEDLPPAPDLKSHRMREQLYVLDTLTDFHRSSQRNEREGEAVPEPQRWGHLDIVEPIGGGSFGTVYQAWDPKLERSVALKILHPSVRGPGGAEIDLMPVPTSTHTSPRTMARTIHEARLLAKVNHPNVVTVFGADAHDELIGIWMELIEGETLWKLVRDRGPLGAREALAIGHDLLGALSAVHGAGILHRDVKAQNVMRARGGRIVLMDFGLGMEAKTERDRSRDWAVGTALYAAPERLRGEEATVQSDLYSLGVLLYFLVTARHPVEGGSFPQLLEAHERGDYRYLRDRRPDLPRAFVEAIERAIRREPEERYRSAGEMDLALAAAEPAVRSPLARTRMATARLRLRRPDWHRAVLLLPALLLVAVAFWLGTLGRFSVEAALFRGLPHGGQASLTARDAALRPQLTIYHPTQLSRDHAEWSRSTSVTTTEPGHRRRSTGFLMRTPN